MRQSPVSAATFALFHMIWICSANTFLIRSDYGMKSNELEQYHRYRNLTGHFRENFFSDISCAQTDHGEMRECLNIAMKTAKESNLFPPLWKNRIAMGTSRRDLLVDCTYSSSIEEFVTIEKHGALYAHFKIQQSNCFSKTDIIGGASFHAVAYSGKFMVSCSIVDLFSNNYTVQCRLPTDYSPTDQILNPTHRNNTVNLSDKRVSCMNISIILVHEHFDAFGREGGMSEIPHSLNHEIFRNKVCHRHGGSAPSHLQHLQDHVSEEVSREHQKEQSEVILNNVNRGRRTSALEPSLGPAQSPSDSHEYVKGIWIRDRSGTAEHPFVEHVYNYKWSSGARDTSRYSEAHLTDHFRAQYDAQLPLMTLSKGNYALCQAKQTNVLLGESHQRFTWSYLAYHYHDGQALYLQTLSEKHGDVSFFRFNLTLKYFIKNIVRHLDDFNCSAYSDPASGLGRNVSIALQMGSWDLSALPLRTVMDSATYGTPALLEAIRRMQLRGCSDSVKIVLVQTMPYPTCNRDDFLCMSSQHWHNNFATAALSEHMLRELSSPAYQYDNVEVIDAVGIMSADLDKYECVNHFLCRHGEKQRYRVASTPSGEALSAEIINALCES